MTAKLIYLCRRKPTISIADWPEMWRSHSRLASSLSNTMGKHFDRITQCTKVHDADVPPEYQNDHDGGNLIAMKSWDDLMAGRNHPDALTIMKKDEERVFADYVVNWTMGANEVPVFDRGGDPRSALMHFFARRHDVSEDAFQKAWTGAFAERIKAVPIVAERARRFALNNVNDELAPPYDFAGVSELWFDDVADSQTAANDPELRAAYKSLETVADLDRSVSLLTRINLDKVAVTNAKGEMEWDVRES